MAAARRAIAEVDPRVPIGTVATMDEVLWESTSQRRLILAVTTVFAVVTLFLALVWTLRDPLACGESKHTGDRSAGDAWRWPP